MSASDYPLFASYLLGYLHTFYCEAYEILIVSWAVLVIDFVIVASFDSYKICIFLWKTLRCDHMMGFFSYPTNFVLRILISFPYAIPFLAALPICPNTCLFFHRVKE